MPAETELCEEFQTSRNIIREVLRALMAKRLVDVKRYRGAFVAPRSQWNYLDTEVLQWVLASDYDPRLIGAMSEVRNLVEPTIARWAAERATSSELAVIESALNDMIAHHQDRDAFNEADIRFHEAVLAAVHNPVLQQLSVAISSLQRAVLNVPTCRTSTTCRAHCANTRISTMPSGIRMLKQRSGRLCR